ncbi:MAG: hypothetical protein A2096_08470 [Spirochaetes bacterium GWF1_41_5]|nr:MAG: hypothetical protein A2096_08470 [Spirochaetes bacterium GWF1_41_5]
MIIKKQKKIRTLINNLDLKIYSIGFADLDKRWKWHIYNVKSLINRLWFIIDGKIELHENNSKVIMKSGNFFLLPRNQAYHVSSSGVKKIWVDFAFTAYNNTDIFDFYSDIITKPFKNNFFKSDLYKYYYSLDIIKLAKIKNQIMELLLSIIEKQYNKDFIKKIQAYSEHGEILDYIERNLSMGLSIRKLAEIANVSNYYISAKFKKKIGITLKQYIENRLLDRIKYDLVYSTKKIKLIANELGFNDQYYFSTFFKKMTGASPVQFRNIYIDS